MEKKYEKCVVNEPMIIDGFEKHAPGKYQILLSEELCPGANFFICGGMHNKIHQTEPIEKHSHDVTEAYLFIGKKGIAEIEVELDDETYRLESPGAIFVPKGVSHLFRYIRIDGPLTVVAIVQDGKYVTY